MIKNDILITQKQRGNPGYLLNLRTLRLNEALQFSSGTRDNPDKHIIEIINNDVEVYFLKPGKEVFNIARPNLHDMSPNITSYKGKFTFEDIWSYLLKLSLLNYDYFKISMILLYRLCYMLDHVNQDSKIRYRPNDNIIKIIIEIDTYLKNIIGSFSLFDLLHFLDLLGWNEDVKYHIESDRPIFNGKYDFKVGRINTILSCISVPFISYEFTNHIIDNSKDLKIINPNIILTAMQRLAKSRGVCVPTQTELLTWLSPLLY